MAAARFTEIFAKVSEKKFKYLQNIVCKQECSKISKDDLKGESEYFWRLWFGQIGQNVLYDLL